MSNANQELCTFIKVVLADYLLSNIQKLLHLYSCNAHGLEFRRKLTGAANLQIVYLIEKKQNTRVLTLLFNKKPRTFCFFGYEFWCLQKVKLWRRRVGKAVKEELVVIRDTNRQHTHFSKKILPLPTITIVNVIRLSHSRWSFMYQMLVHLS